MLAIHERAALRNLHDAGLALDRAQAILDSLKPATRFDGARYFNPRDLARASKGN